MLSLTGRNCGSSFSKCTLRPSRTSCANDPRVTIGYGELLHLWTVGMASSDEEAMQMAHVLDQAGVVFNFREIVHLHLGEIPTLATDILPLSLLGEVEQRKELKSLMETKKELDKKAQKRGRITVVLAFLLAACVMVMFRLAYWELSWEGPFLCFIATGGFLRLWADFLRHGT